MRSEISTTLGRRFFEERAPSVKKTFLPKRATYPYCIGTAWRMRFLTSMIRLAVLPFVVVLLQPHLRVFCWPEEPQIHMANRHYASMATERMGCYPYLPKHDESDEKHSGGRVGVFHGPVHDGVPAVAGDHCKHLRTSNVFFQAKVLLVSTRRSNRRR